MKGIIIGYFDDPDLESLATRTEEREEVTWLKLGLPASEYDVLLSNTGSPVIFSNDCMLDAKQVESSQWIFYKKTWLHDPPVVKAVDLETADEQAFAEREWAATVESAMLYLFLTSQDPWVTPHFGIDLIDRKPYLLMRASSMGAAVPPFVISNKLRGIRRGVDYVVKAINKSSYVSETHYFPTTLLPPETLSSYTDVPVSCPTFAQVYVKRRKEIRAYFVRGCWISCILELDADQIDLKYLTVLESRPFSLSLRHQDVLSRLCVEAGLSYCTFDFVLDEDDQEWLVDVTPNGSWSWYETAGDVDLSGPILSALEGLTGVDKS